MKKLLMLFIAVALMICTVPFNISNAHAVTYSIHLSEAMVDDTGCEPEDLLWCARHYKELTRQVHGGGYSTGIDWTVEVSDGYEKVIEVTDGYILYGTMIQHCCGLEPPPGSPLSIIGKFSKEDGSPIWKTSFSGMSDFNRGTHKIIANNNAIYILETYPAFDQLYPDKENYKVTATYWRDCPADSNPSCGLIAPFSATLNGKKSNGGIYDNVVLLWTFNSSGHVVFVKHLFEDFHVLGQYEEPPVQYTPVSPFEFITDCDSIKLIKIKDKYYTLGGELTKANLECEEEEPEVDCDTLKAAMKNGDKTAEIAYVKLCSESGETGIAKVVVPIAGCIGFILMSAVTCLILKKSTRSSK